MVKQTQGAHSSTSDFVLKTRILLLDCVYRLLCAAEEQRFCLNWT